MGWWINKRVWYVVGWRGGGEREKRIWERGVFGYKRESGVVLGLGLWEDRLLYFGLDWDKLGSIMTVESWYLAQAIGILCLA